MNNSDIVLRQQRLLARSAQLRSTLTDQTQALEESLLWIGKASSSLAWLRQNPQWPLGAVLLLAVLRPRRVMRWGSRMWWGWQTSKRVRHWLEINALRI